MNTKKLILGISSARITTLGLVAMPALIDPALAGPTDAQRKVLFFTDPDTALLLGIKTDSLAIEPTNTVRLDHAELPARYAGATFDGHDYLESVFDMSNTRVLDRHISDVSTIMFVLSKRGAQKLGLIENAADHISTDALLVAVQGQNADLIMDKILDAGVYDELPRKQIAAFFASEVFDSMPDATPVSPNGHDAAAATA